MTTSILPAASGRRILRHEVPVDDAWHTLALSGPIVHIATRDASIVEVRAVDDGSEDRTSRIVMAVGTGHPLPAAFDLRVLGSAISPSGSLVWHLIERVPR